MSTIKILFISAFISSLSLPAFADDGSDTPPSQKPGFFLCGLTSVGIGLSGIALSICEPEAAEAND